MASALSVLLSAGPLWAQTTEEPPVEAPAAEEGEGEEVLPGAEEYPEEIEEDPEDDRERFTDSSGANWGVPEALRLYQASEDAYDAGRYQEAAAFLLRVIELDPEAPDLYYNIALVYEHLQEYDRALEYLDQYRSFDIGAQEQRRVERMMVRIRGAQESLPPDPQPQTRTRVVVRRFGRADGLFWGMLGATVLFAGATAITGGLALHWSNATGEFVYDLDIGYDLNEYARWVDIADTLALTTDILIGVTSVAALTALFLYVFRTHPEIEVREEVGAPGEEEGEAREGDSGGEPEGAETPGEQAPDETSWRPSVLLGLGGAMIRWEF